MAFRLPRCRAKQQHSRLTINRRYRRLLPMMDTKVGQLSMTTKKIWTAPAIQVIRLDSARQNNHGSINDGMPNRS
jgi:hypothetical protein